MGKFRAACCPLPLEPDNAESSGTISAVFSVPAKAKSVTLNINTTGSVQITGEINATFSGSGTSRTWTARDGSYFPQGFTFAGVGTTQYEVNYIL